MSFDLQSLHELDPPAALCTNCQAIYLKSDWEEAKETTKEYLNQSTTKFTNRHDGLLTDYYDTSDDSTEVLKSFRKILKNNEDIAYRCQGCNQSLTFSPYTLIEGKPSNLGGIPYDTDDQLELVIDNFTQTRSGDIHLLEENYSLSHLMNLSWKANQFNKSRDISYLIQTIADAEKFIHFSTFTLDLFFYGILTTAAQNTAVRGMVGKEPKDWKQDIIIEGSEAANIESKYESDFELYYDRDNEFETVHQKLIVIDGLIAFSGSMNLTSSGIKKFKQNRDNLEAKTVIEDVQKLNNQFFANNFYRLEQDYKAERREKEDGDEIPF